MRKDKARRRLLVAVAVLGKVAYVTLARSEYLMSQMLCLHRTRAHRIVLPGIYAVILVPVRDDFTDLWHLRVSIDRRSITEGVHVVLLVRIEQWANYGSWISI